MHPASVSDLSGGADTQVPTFVGRLAVNGVPTRRNKAPKLNGGIAAHTSSDVFKSFVQTIAFDC